ncbi:MAG: hypothetical protein QG673_734 [Pseudomonadota bacterium]|nr:hypothetical protein [Pseudomonadota bacterium]
MSSPATLRRSLVQSSPTHSGLTQRLSQEFSLHSIEDNCSTEDPFLMNSNASKLPTYTLPFSQSGDTPPENSLTSVSTSNIPSSEDKKTPDEQLINSIQSLKLTAPEATGLLNALKKNSKHLSFTCPVGEKRITQIQHLLLQIYQVKHDYRPGTTKELLHAGGTKRYSALKKYLIMLSTNQTGGVTYEYRKNNNTYDKFLATNNNDENNSINSPSTTVGNLQQLTITTTQTNAVSTTAIEPEIHISDASTLFSMVHSANLTPDEASLFIDALNQNHKTLTIPPQNYNQTRREALKDAYSAIIQNKATGMLGLRIKNRYKVIMNYLEHLKNKEPGIFVYDTNIYLSSSLHNETLEKYWQTSVNRQRQYYLEEILGFIQTNSQLIFSSEENHHLRTQLLAPSKDQNFNNTVKIYYLYKMLTTNLKSKNIAYDIEFDPSNPQQFIQTITNTLNEQASTNLQPDDELTCLLINVFFSYQRSIQKLNEAFALYINTPLANNCEFKLWSIVKNGIASADEKNNPLKLQKLDAFIKENPNNVYFGYASWFMGLIEHARKNTPKSTAHFVTARGVMPEAKLILTFYGHLPTSTSRDIFHESGLPHSLIHGYADNCFFKHSKITENGVDNGASCDQFKKSAFVPFLQKCLRQLGVSESQRVMYTTDKYYDRTRLEEIATVIPGFIENTKPNTN